MATTVSFHFIRCVCWLVKLGRALYYINRGSAVDLASLSLVRGLDPYISYLDGVTWSEALSRQRGSGPLRSFYGYEFNYVPLSTHSLDPYQWQLGMSKLVQGRRSCSPRYCDAVTPSWRPSGGSTLRMGGATSLGASSRRRPMKQTEAAAQSWPRATITHPAAVHLVKSRSQLRMRLDREAAFTSASPWDQVPSIVPRARSGA
jgi:hypothetical protein